MGLKSFVITFFSVMFVLFVISILVVYWLPFSFNSFEFSWDSSNINSNFTINSSIGGGMQFYDNLRFSSSRISYRIGDCSVKRTEDMTGAFSIIANKTILDFYPVYSDEEIHVTCSNDNRIEGGLFIAGEGGPTNITQGGFFNLIHEGKILLLKDSDCPKPNIAIHELLHVLGFEHSNNKKNIMYNITNCDQEIGDDTIQLINELYSYESLPDLLFTNVSASLNGRYLNANLSIRNYGLRDSENFDLIIFVDGKELKKFDFENLEAGYGRRLNLENIFVSDLSVEYFEFLIDSDFRELDKENNKIKLNIKE